MYLKIYTSDISELYDEKTFCKKYAEVSLYRQKKIDNTKLKDDKCRSLGAGLLLKNALAECGIDEKNAEYVVDSHKKPSIKNSDIHFSLSHSGYQVMCAVADCPVGCDVEQIKNPDLKIAKRFFTESENKLIDSQPTLKEKTDMFYRLWTLKESFMKVTGLGLALPINEFSIIIADKITVCHNLDDKKYDFFEINKNNGYKYSYCIKTL